MSNIFDFKIQCFHVDPNIFDSEGSLKWIIISFAPLDADLPT